MVSSSRASSPRLYLLRNVLIALFCLFSCCVVPAAGTKSIRGLQTQPTSQTGTGDQPPKGGGFQPERDVEDEREIAYYQFDLDGRPPSTQPSLSPTRSPSENPTRLPQSTPREPFIDTDSPTSPEQTPSPSIEPTNTPSVEPTQSPITESLTKSPTHSPTTQSPPPPTEAPTESYIMGEAVQAQEQQQQHNIREPIVDDADPNDADQFLPVADPTYYRIDLRPFAVFVDADRDLSTDLGIPLYLLLEMGEFLTSLVDIKITNLTILMGVVRTNNRRRLSSIVNHYHWNQLFFQGFAQLEESTEYDAEFVQEIQSQILSNPDGLQQFWKDEGFGEIYSNLELMNITLLPFPAIDEPPSETLSPTQEIPAVTLPDEETSKRESNIWIMVPIVLVFLLICFCIICLAGRLQYLANRAQDKYDEKYGLDYNIYDKDISKDIFKEEYLMSEHQGDSDFGHSDHIRSIDFYPKSKPSMKGGSSRRSSGRKRVQFPIEDNSTTEEEEEIPAEQRNQAPQSAEQIGAFPSLAPRTSDRNVVIDAGMILPTLGVNADSDSDSDDDLNESVPADEDDIAVQHSSSIGAAKDSGDEMPTIIKVGGPSLLDGDNSERDEVRSSDDRSRDDATFASKETKLMGNLSNNDRSARDRSYRYQKKGTNSFNSTGSDRGVTGNSSRGSRGDRSSRFGRKGSFNTGGEDLGGSIRSTRSNRSVRSGTSDSSLGSFYSCQGDLV